MGAPRTLLRLCRSGVEFRKIGVGRSLSDVVMTWLMLQTPVKCIPHAFHIYTVFQHLDMRWMGTESNPTLLRLGRSGVDFRKIGVWLSWSDVVM